MDGLRARPVLPHSLVGAVDKGLVLDERPTTRGSELNAPERGDGLRGIVEKVLGIKNLIAVEEESSSVKIVCAALGYGVDDSAGGSSVLCGVVAGEKRELLDTVNAQIETRGASRSAV